MPLIMQLDADTKKATSKIKAASKSAGQSVKQLEKKSVSSAAKMTSSFSRLAGIAGIGGVGFALRAVIKQLAGFETALAEVSTLVDTSVVTMRDFNIEILKLTTGIPKSAVDITKGLYEVISAGVTDASDALLVLEVSAKAATGGLTTTNIAVDAITTILNAYQKSAEEAADISDVLFTTVRLGKTRFAPLAQSIGIVATSAALAGVSIEELGAAFGTMTKFGIKTEITATSLNRLFLQIVNPTTQLKEKSKELGVEFNAAALRTKSFAGFMKELTEKFSEDQDAIFSLGVDLRAFRALSILGGKGAEEFSDQLLQMKDRANAAEVAMEKINKTMEAQAQILKNKLNVDLQEIGRVILPVVVKGFDALLFAISPVNSMLNIYDEAVKNANKSTTEANKQNRDFLDILNGTTKAVKELMDVVLPDAPNVPFINVPNEEMELLLPPIEEVISGLGEAETLSEKWAKNQAALALTIPELPKNIKIVNKEMEAASRAAGTFSQNLARALISGKGLEKSLLSAAISLGLSFIPGGSLFGGLFGHGGTAPGGFVPSIVGEGGGAPEIVQSASPIKVTPLTTNNNKFNNNFTLVFPAVRELDEFELATNVIPKINALIQGGESRLSASEIV